MVEDDLKSLALKERAIRVGIAHREALSEVPSLADMRYEEPRANAVGSACAAGRTRPEGCVQT